tara:strand:+ start:352 stop:3579 length:3228 start_codon:yes stop_codon:yes gene_type:complete
MSLFAFGTGAFRAASRNLQNIQQTRGEIAKEERAGQEARDLLKIKNDYATEGAIALAKTRAKEASLERDFRAGENVLNRLSNEEIAQERSKVAKINNLFREVSNYKFYGGKRTPENHAIKFKRFSGPNASKQFTQNVIAKLGLLGDEGLKNLYSDAGTAKDLNNLLSELFVTYENDFRVPETSQGGLTKYKKAPYPTIQFSAVLENNPFLRSKIQAIQNVQLPSVEPTKVTYTEFVNGSEQKVSMLEGEKNQAAITNGALFFANNTLNSPKDAVGVYKAIDKKYSIGIDSEDDLKYWKFAADPRVQKYIGNTAVASAKTEKDFLDYIMTEANGFAIYENGKFRGFNSDLNLALDVFGNKRAYKGKEGEYKRKGVPYNAKTFGNVRKNDKNLDKIIQGIREQSAATKAAEQTLAQLIKNYDVEGVSGFSFLNKLNVIVGAGTELVPEIKRLASVYFKTKDGTRTVLDDSGQAVDIKRFSDKKISIANGDDEDGYIGWDRFGRKRRYQGTVKDRIENAFRTFTLGETPAERSAMASAQIEALEIILAYQLTSILQGGTGGRTISDQDVTRTLKVFSGSFVSKKQKMAKLQYLRGYIGLAGAKARLYDKVAEDDANYNSYLMANKLKKAMNSAYRRFGEIPANIDDLERQYARVGINEEVDKKWKNIPQANLTVLNEKILIRNKDDEKGFDLDEAKQWAENSGIKTNDSMITFTDPKLSNAKFIYSRQSIKRITYYSVEALKKHLHNIARIPISRLKDHPDVLAEWKRYQSTEGTNARIVQKIKNAVKGDEKVIEAMTPNTEGGAWAAPTAYAVNTNQAIAVTITLDNNLSPEITLNEAELSRAGLQLQVQGGGGETSAVEPAVQGGEASPAVTAGPIRAVRFTKDTRSISTNFKGKAVSYTPKTVSGEEFKKQFYDQARALTVPLFGNKKLPEVAINALFNISGKESGHNTDKMRIGTRTKKGGGTETNGGLIQWREDRLGDFVAHSGENPLNSIQMSLSFIMKELSSGEGETGINKDKYKKLLEDLMLADKRGFTAEQLEQKLDTIYVRSSRDTNLRNASTKLFTSKIKKSLEGSN